MGEELSKEIKTYSTKPSSNLVQRIIYTIYGALSAIFAFRLFFKLLGANPENIFVKGIYRVTQPIVGIFEGIFASIAINGEDSGAVFEPATLIAMVVLALIAWIVLKIITPGLGTHVEEVEYKRQEKIE